MRWRDGPSSTAQAAERRLRELAEPWRPGTPSGGSQTGADSGAGIAGRTGGRDTGGWRDEGEPARHGIRIGPWPRRATRGLVLLVAIAVALGAYVTWHASPKAVVQAPELLAAGAPMGGHASTPSPSPGPVSPAPAASPDVVAGEVVVHVAGLVARPGLVRLPVGSRVADAVSAAGGVTRRRAADTVNLARVLVDGEQIVVADPASVAPAATSPTAGVPVVLDLNAATAEVLDSLPGVGPVLAARIVSWRSANGPFRSVDELAEVSGIGQAVLSQVRPLVRV